MAGAHISKEERMNKRVVPHSTVGTYWIWEMPELAKEISRLLSAAGKAKVVGKSAFGVRVQVELKTPAKVIDWRHDWGDGVAVNSDTFACIGQRPSVSVHPLPKSGDKRVNLTIDLQLDTFKEGDMVTLDDTRKDLEAFAAAMTRTWYYHFK